MTDLALNEESTQYQELARDFAQKEIAPQAEKLDQQGKFPLNIYQAAWEIGLLTASIPENFGGLGLSLPDACVISEEISSACSGVAAAIEGNMLAMAGLMAAGSPAQQEKYLSILTDSCSFAGYCFNQSQINAHPNQTAATYRKNGSSYEISADDILTLNAEHANWYFLVASDADSGQQSAFIIEAKTEGFSRLQPPYKLGRKCADLGRLKLNKLTLGKEQLLGDEGAWQNFSGKAFCLSTPIIAAHATGIARAALEHSTRYSKERFTFGQPIGNYQGISFMLADIAKNCEAARLLARKSAFMTEQGIFDQTQATAALAFALDGAMTAATNAVQIYGGYGYSREYPVEKLMRDAKVMQVMLTDGTDYKTAIGRELIGLS